MNLLPQPSTSPWMFQWIGNRSGSCGQAHAATANIAAIINNCGSSTRQLRVS